VDETAVWISLNGRRTILLTCAPTETDALALGHLLAEGWIERAEDVRSLRTVSGPGGACGVEIEVDDALLAGALSLRRHRLEHGCGLRHLLDCAGRQDASAARGTDTPVKPTAPALLGDAFRALFAAADAASPHGGVHAAALGDGHGLHHAAVDVARHCAVDRAIGLACLSGEDPGRYGLLSTSRISGAIALKAVNTGLRWVASRSVATPLAHEIAAAGGVHIIERAARRTDRSP
jgi:FdhD protein